MKNLLFFGLITLCFACKEKAIPYKEAALDPYLAGVHFMGHAKIGMSKADLLKFYPNLVSDSTQSEALGIHDRRFITSFISNIFKNSKYYSFKIYFKRIYDKIFSEYCKYFFKKFGDSKLMRNITPKFY